PCALPPARRGCAVWPINYVVSKQIWYRERSFVPAEGAGLSECGSQQREALRDGRLPVFLALEFQGNVAVVVVSAEHRGNSRIVEFQRVPDTAAIVGLGLYEHRVRCE